MEPDNAPPTGNTATASSRDRRILLNVLSPSSEVPHKLIYPDFPTSTTIIDLKRRIQNDVPTRPSPDRQRLIYRGRALVQDDRTLEDILGHETVCSHVLSSAGMHTKRESQLQASDVHSLHLVLPPIPGSSTPSSSDPFVRHANLTPTPLVDPHHPQNSSLALPPRPASTGQLPLGAGAGQVLPIMNNAGSYYTPTMGQTMVINPGPLPPEMQEQLNAHLAAMTQPHGGGAAPGGYVPNIGGQNIHGHVGAWPQQPAFPQLPLFPQPNVQHFLAQQQQARAMAGMQGVGNRGINPGLNQEATQATQQAQGPGDTNNMPNGPLAPGTSSTVVREGHGPNGAQWRLVINQSVTPLNPMGQHAQDSTQQPGSQPASIPGHFTATPPNIHPGQTSPTFDLNLGRRSPAPITGRDNAPRDEAYAIIDLRLSHLERSLAHGVAPTDNEIIQAQHQLLNWQGQQPVFNGSLEVPLVTRMTSIATRANQIRQVPRGSTIQPAHLHSSVLPTTSSSAGQSTTGNTAALTAMPATSANTMVYLLSSPSGPHALLVSPMGIYSSSGPGVGMNQPVSSAFTQTPGPRQANQTVPTFARPNEPGVPAGQDPQRDPQVQQPEQARDLVRILLPLGGHLWLLIRLFGFVYFFTSGAGWYRTMLLGFCALFVFVAQIGILRPLQRAIWDPIRRHVEALVPLAVNNGNAGANGGPAQPNGPGGPATQPDPRQMADRILQNRNGERGLVRRNVRRVERAMALFIASLVPGVGERHIAARDAAEAARQAIEREREEQARREEEARQQAESNQESVAERDSATTEDDPVRQEDQVRQQPLVEI